MLFNSLWGHGALFKPVGGRGLFRPAFPLWEFAFRPFPCLLASWNNSYFCSRMPPGHGFFFLVLDAERVALCVRPQLCWDSVSQGDLPCSPAEPALTLSRAQEQMPANLSDRTYHWGQADCDPHGFTKGLRVGQTLRRFHPLWLRVRSVSVLLGGARGRRLEMVRG